MKYLAHASVDLQTLYCCVEAELKHTTDLKHFSGVLRIRRTPLNVVRVNN
jgi:hypothetical protein